MDLSDCMFKLISKIETNKIICFFVLILLFVFLLLHTYFHFAGALRIWHGNLVHYKWYRGVLVY